MKKIFLILIVVLAFNIKYSQSIIADYFYGPVIIAGYVGYQDFAIYDSVKYYPVVIESDTVYTDSIGRFWYIYKPTENRPKNLKVSCTDKTVTVKINPKVQSAYLRGETPIIYINFFIKGGGPYPKSGNSHNPTKGLISAREDVSVRSLQKESVLSASGKFTC